MRRRRRRAPGATGRGRGCPCGRPGTARTAARPARPTSPRVDPMEFSRTTAGAPCGPAVSTCRSTVTASVLPGSGRRDRAACPTSGVDSPAASQGRREVAGQGVGVHLEAGERHAQPGRRRRRRTRTAGSAAATPRARARRRAAVRRASAASRVATRPGACIAAARAVIAAMGLCLCAIADDPPRPPRAPPPPRPARAARRRAPPCPRRRPPCPARRPGRRSGVRSVCQHSSGSASPRARGERGPHGRPVRVPGGQGAARPAELDREHPDRCSSPAAARSSPAPHPAATAPKVVGTACCSSVRPIITVSRCAAASPAAASARGAQVGDDEGQRVAGHEHRRRVEDVLARRPAVHRGRPSAGGLDVPAQQVDQRDDRVAARLRGPAEFGGVGVGDDAAGGADAGRVGRCR